MDNIFSNKQWNFNVCHTYSIDIFVGLENNRVNSTIPQQNFFLNKKKKQKLKIK